MNVTLDQLFNLIGINILTGFLVSALVGRLFGKQVVKTALFQIVLFLGVGTILTILVVGRGGVLVGFLGPIFTYLGWLLYYKMNKIWTI